MMTDRQLEQLLRMANEAEAMAQADLAALDERWRLPTARRPGAKLWTRVGVLAGVAAGLGMAVGMWMLSVRPPSKAVGPVAFKSDVGGPAAASRGGGAGVGGGGGVGGVGGIVDSGWAQIEALFDLARPKQGSVVMAIAQDSAGGIRCVQWAEHEWSGGRQLSEVDPAELKALGKSMICEREAPRVVVVGLEGPGQMLPQSEAFAAEVARCIVATSACQQPGWNAAGCAESSCMPGSVTMRMETLALGR